MQKSRTTEAEATATGNLMVAADAAEKLTVVLTALQQIVKARTVPTALIGLPMAEVIETYAVEIVEAIREAHHALNGTD